MLDRADEDRNNPRAPWNQPDAELKKYEVTVQLSREITQVVVATNQEEAMENAETICSEQDLGLEPEALWAEEV